MLIELHVLQFWSEIIFVPSNPSPVARSFDFEIMDIIGSNQKIALHSFQQKLLLYIVLTYRLLID